MSPVSEFERALVNIESYSVSLEYGLKEIDDRVDGKRYRGFRCYREHQFIEVYSTEDLDYFVAQFPYKITATLSGLDEVDDIEETIKENFDVEFQNNLLSVIQEPDLISTIDKNDHGLFIGFNVKNLIFP